WIPHNGTLTTRNGLGVYEITKKGEFSRLERNVNLVEGNKYYMKVDILPKYNSQTRIQIGGVDSDVFNVISNSWNTISSVLRAVSQERFRIYHATTGDYVIGDEVLYNNALVIDLTETFGKGKEPS